MKEQDINSGKKLHGTTELWDYYLSKGYQLHFDLNMKGTSVQVARFYVGKILEQLQPILPKYKPAIFMEEADILFPKMDSIPSELYPLSLTQGIQYAHKIQRFGVELFTIVQDPKRIHDAFNEFCLREILGHVDSISETKKLKWQHDKNYRQFLFRQRGLTKPSGIVFEPDEMYCLPLDRSMSPLHSSQKTTWRSSVKSL